MPLKKRKPSAESPEQPPETQFVPQDDDEEAMYEAEAILDEKPFQRLFLVKWVGDDPDTGLPWEPTWEPKSGASQDLIDEWKAKKRTDPTIVGRYVRAEAARKKQQADEAKELKRRKAQAAQDKKKRKAESIASGDTPKRARLDTNKPVSKTVSTASKGSPQVKGVTKTAKPATRQSSIASPATNKQTVAGPSRAVSDDDTSFEILDESATFAEPDETFRPDDSLSQPIVTRRQPARAKSKSSEPGLAPRATRKAAATTVSTDGEGPVAEVEPAVDSRKKVRDPKTKKAKSAEKDQTAAERDNAVDGPEVQEEPAAGVEDKQPGKTGRKVKLHMGKKQREDGGEDGTVAGEDKAPAAVAPSKDAGAEAPSIGNDDAAVVEPTSTDKQKASTAPIETGTVSSATENPPAKTPDGKNGATAVKDPAAKDTSQRPHTLMEGAKSPNITMVRPPRLAAVPQPPSAMFRQLLPETQSTEGDKSIPMSQADPIADFSSPSREESSGSARRSRRIDKAPSAQQSPAPSRVAKAEAHGQTASRVVPKMIDGELWITAAETQATHLGAGEENGVQMEVDSAPVVEAAGEDAGPVPPNGSDEDLAELASPPTEPSENGRSEADAGVSSNKNFDEVMKEFERWKKVAAQNAMDAARRNGTVIDPKIIVEKDNEIAILKKRIEGLEANLVDAGKRSTESSAKEANVAEGNKKLIEQVDEATVRFEKVQKELGEAQAAIAQMSKQHQKADDALRAELAAANARVVEHETALVQVRKVAEDMAQDSAKATALSNDAAIETLRAELATATTEKETLSRKVENMSTDNDFLRQQYQQASNSAVASVRRSAELEERVKKLESQLKVGLKQKDMHYAAIHAKREAEAVKLRATNAFLLEQSRRTDDAVRRKAALYDKYKAEHDLLRQSEQAWADRYAALQERNEDLADQVAALRGRQMGVFDVGGGELGESDYSEGDAEDDITDDDERAASSGPIGGFTASQIGAVAGLATQSSEMSGDPFRRSPAPGEVARIPYGDDEQMAEGEVEVLIDGGEAFRCLWRRNDGTGCDVVFDHHEDLAHHAKVHAFEVVVKPEL